MNSNTKGLRIAMCLAVAAQYVLAAEPEEPYDPADYGTPLSREQFSLPDIEWLGSPKPVVGRPCTDLPGSGKKCLLQPELQIAFSSATTVGLSPGSHFIAFTQPTSASVNIEIQFDYRSSVCAVADPDIRFSYRLLDENGSVLATIPFEWSRKRSRHVERKSYVSGTENLDIVRRTKLIDLQYEFRFRDSKKCP